MGSLSNQNQFALSSDGCLPRESSMDGYVRIDSREIGNVSGSIEQLMTRRDFYTMKDFETTDFKRRQSRNHQKEIRSSFSADNLVQKYCLERDELTKPFTTDEIKLLQKNTDLSNSELQNEVVTNEELLEGLARKLVAVTFIRLQEESDLKKEHERCLRLELLQEEMRQYEMKSKLEKARSLIESSQLTKRKLEISNDLRQLQVKKQLETADHENDVEDENQDPSVESITCVANAENQDSEGQRLKTDAQEEIPVIKMEGQDEEITHTADEKPESKTYQIKTENNSESEQDEITDEIKLALKRNSESSPLLDIKLS